MYSDAAPVICIFRRLDEGVVAVRNDAVRNGDDSHGTGTIPGSVGGFKIDSYEIHCVAKLGLWSVRFNQNLRLAMIRLTFLDRGNAVELL